MRTARPTHAGFAPVALGLRWAKRRTIPSMRWVLIPTLAFVVLLGAGCGQGQGDASTGNVRASGEAKPVLLLFHGGGFLFGSSELMAEEARLARRYGFEAVAVTYPLNDPEAALRVARKQAQKYPRAREVYAYGESAGGALAGRLAQARRLGVDGAALYSPLVDTTTFQDGLFADAERLPLWGRSVRGPTLALVAEQEDPPYARDIRRWARSDRRVRLSEVPGDHLGSGGEHAANAQRAIEFLDRKAQG